jgi:hypothetical protein
VVMRVLLNISASPYEGTVGVARMPRRVPDNTEAGAPE